MTEILYALAALALVMGLGLAFYKLTFMAFLRTERWLILRTGKATDWNQLGGTFYGNV